MKPRHQVSRAGVVLIKRFEGLRAKAAQLDDGRWTLGYGHTKTARGGAVITEADAEALLLYDLIEVAHVVNEWTFVPLNQNEFDALVSFAFNIGLENFQRSTTLRRLNEGRPLEAALAMELWRRADIDGERIVVDALVRRRAFEKALFLKPVDAWAPAPTPVLPPRLDYDSGALTPSSIPQVVLARLEGDRAIADWTGGKPMAALEGPDEGPSASEAAAAAVAARLEAILAETEPAAPEAAPAVLNSPAACPPQDVPSAEVAVEAPLAPLFPDDDWSEPPRPAAPAVVVKEEVPEDTADAAALDGPIDLTPRRRAAVRRERASLILLLGLLFVGGVLFYSAVRWGFSPAVSSDSSTTLVALGWVAGALGIVSCGTAAYLLLARLGDRD